MTSVAYYIVASSIFAFVVFNFFFPCNQWIPLDRRTTAVLGAILCYLTRRYMFPSNAIDLVQAVDFDVLILLASIMVINHLVIHLKETRSIIDYLQRLVARDPIRGLWVVSLCAFIASPFLTNDGVCLLFVEPILKAFSATTSEPEQQDNALSNDGKLVLRKQDVLYFLLGLACSANIGSALTYTGNPQNMIVASDSLYVLPSYKFFLYMLPASLFSWVATVYWIQVCWLKSRNDPVRLSLTEDGLEAVTASGDTDVKSPMKVSTTDAASEKCWNMSLFPAKSPDQIAVLSPRRQRSMERLRLVGNVVRFVKSPFPYAVIGLLVAMIIMIFVDVMPISGLICLFAMIMVVTVVLGNHCRNRHIWVEKHGQRTTRANSHTNTEPQSGGALNISTTYAPEEFDHDSEEGSLGPMTKEDRMDNLNEFFEALFGAIDYSILIIFLGLFIVVENMSSTGIPKAVWDSIAGTKPFKSFSSIVGISAFILITSQFLGNVPVIQLAKPNVVYLDDESKRLAWAIISFVATVGGNLTITGSAANIIVAEKAARLDASLSLDFFFHYKVCFWITLLSCCVGGCMIAAIATVDNASGSAW